MSPDNRRDESPSEEMIDRTLADSFPASDPPSWTLGRDHDQELERGDAESAGAAPTAADKESGASQAAGLKERLRARAFLFDLDGTLVDSVYQHVLSWHEALAASGFELAVWRIHRRIGMSGGLLVNALLRDVRFMCAIGLHTQGMTVEQCEKLFRESAFSDVGTARQQAARGTYDPAYLNYTLGKLMIRKLRTDWMAANPVPAGVDSSSPQKWQAFHDKFLSYGGPPIPLVRKAMMGGDGKAVF